MRSWCAFFAILGVATWAGCALILGLDDYVLLCPPDDPACIVCGNPGDCGPAEPCRPWECVKNVCKLRYLQPGAPCPAGICNSNADCVECFRDADCGNMTYCDNNRCQPLRCEDGIENGDEWEIDCGGHCPLCLGDPCSPGEICRSGFCTNGHCCEIACTDICTYCDMSGACLYIPQYGDDPPLCDGALVCNGGGACAKRNGEPCTGDGECASLKCVGMKCVP